MGQRYNDNIKRSKPQDTLLAMLKIYTFWQKIQQRASDPRESTGGVTQYMSLRIHPKTLRFKQLHSSSTVVT